MTSTPVRILAATCLTVCLAQGIIAAQPAPQPAVPPDGIAALLRRLQQAVAAGDRASVLALGDAQISRPSFEEFAATLTVPPPTRVVVTERDRAPHDAGRPVKIP